MRVGWKGLERIYYTVLHFDVKDGKIWLQHNATDIDIGQELVEMGIRHLQEINYGLPMGARRCIWDIQIADFFVKLSPKC